jgi:hypothetical protein
MHCEVVTSVQVVGSGGTSVGQVVPSLHAAVLGAPPLQVLTVWLWQIIWGPQSALLAHGASWQWLLGTTGSAATPQVVPPSTRRQIAGVATVGSSWQRKPLAQSASVAQVCARPRAGTVRARANVASPKPSLAGAMAFSFA